GLRRARLDPERRADPPLEVREGHLVEHRRLRVLPRLFQPAGALQPTAKRVCPARSADIRLTRIRLVNDLTRCSMKFFPQAGAGRLGGVESWGAPPRPRAGAAWAPPRTTAEAGPENRHPSSGNNDFDLRPEARASCTSQSTFAPPSRTMRASCTASSRAS